jgi:hypothetical protein
MDKPILFAVMIMINTSASESVNDGFSLINGNLPNRTVVSEFTQQMEASAEGSEQRYV